MTSPMHKYIASLHEFICMEAPEDFSDEAGQERANNLVSCLQLITGDCRSCCWEYFDNYLEEESKEER
tara:strand:+ start:192 stop:395 length:204 start_codon:yes stop_codon:yes gene_type:complete